MPPVKAELELVQPIVDKLGKFKKTPNMIYTVYKARASKYPKEIKIFLYVDFGTMRVTDLFCTDKNYQLINVEKVNVNVLEEIKAENNKSEEVEISY